MHTYTLFNEQHHAGTRVALSVLELAKPDGPSTHTSSLHGGTGGSAAVGALALRDLLHDPLDASTPPHPGPLRLREHPVEGPFVENLTVVELPSLGELHQVLGFARRRLGAGGAAAHVLATVYIQRCVQVLVIHPRADRMMDYHEPVVVVQRAI